MDELRFLEDWYAQQCDGDWEHGWGVSLETLDNPGWRLTVDLEGTSWFGRVLEREVIERSGHDWLQVWSDGQRFEAACGPQNLSEVLGRFRAFVAPPISDDRRASMIDEGELRIRFAPVEP